MSPAMRNKAPEIQMGTDVVRLAYNAMMGAIMPKTRFPVAVSPFPVPRSFVGNNSGDMAYRTPYIT